MIPVRRGVARNTSKTFTAEDITKYGTELTQVERAMLLASLGNNYETIAAEFKIPIGTVKSRISRARVVVAREKDRDIGLPHSQ